MDKHQRDKFLHHYWQVWTSCNENHDIYDDNDQKMVIDNNGGTHQEIMMLLIGESSMSNAHLVNGAVVNVRARVSLSFVVLEYEQG